MAQTSFYNSSSYQNSFIAQEVNQHIAKEGRNREQGVLSTPGHFLWGLMDLGWLWDCILTVGTHKNTLITRKPKGISGAKGKCGRKWQNNRLLREEALWRSEKNLRCPPEMGCRRSAPPPTYRHLVHLLMPPISL